MVKFKKWLLRKIFNRKEINIIFSALHQTYTKYKELNEAGEYTNEKVLEMLQETRDMFM